MRSFLEPYNTMTKQVLISIESSYSCSSKSFPQGINFIYLYWSREENTDMRHREVTLLNSFIILWQISSRCLQVDVVIVNGGQAVWRHIIEEHKIIFQPVARGPAPSNLYTCWSATPLWEPTFSKEKWSAVAQDFTEEKSRHIIGGWNKW